MLNAVDNYIKANKMIAPNDHIIVGLSGGADSVCLLYVLNNLASKYDISLEAVHVHHMIRGEEADRDAAFAREYASKLGIEFMEYKFDVTTYAKENNLTVEEAGRKLRYQAFNERAGLRKNAKIALAHHKNDQAETVIYQMARGSSVKGVGGIRPVRDNIIRPLLGVSRDDIVTFLRNNKIEYCTDSTNLSNDYARNNIRNVVIPELESKINSESVNNIAALAADLQEVYDYVDGVAKNTFAQCIKREEDGLVILSCKQLTSNHPIITREVIHSAIARVCDTAKDITRKHVEAVLDLANSDGNKEINLAYSLVVRKSYDDLIFEVGERKEIYTYQFEGCKVSDFIFEEEIFNIDSKFETNDYTKILDCDRIYSTVSVRHRMPGDYITISKDGKRKLLKRFWIDEKIPNEIRDKVWLVADGNHILWIVGYRISEVLKIDKDTARVLKISVKVQGV